MNATALSHGHYDHAGGLLQILNGVTEGILLYLRPLALRPRYKLVEERLFDTAAGFGERRLADSGAIIRHTVVRANVRKQPRRNPKFYDAASMSLLISQSLSKASISGANLGPLSDPRTAKYTALKASLGLSAISLARSNILF